MTVPLRKSVAAAALLVIFLSARLAWGGPPFITDDPDPVEYQHWEVYLFSIYNHIHTPSNNPAGIPTDFSQLPAVEVNYGLLPDMHVHLIAPLAYSREAGGNPQYGIGDTELGVKYRFFHETDYLPEVGTFPLVELPTGPASRDLGSGYTQVFLPIWLQKSFGEDKKWTTYGGGGFWYTPGNSYRNFYRFGWEVQRDLSEQLTLGAEVFHETPTAVGIKGHTAFNVGGYWNFDEHQHLLFSAGRDIEGPNRFSCYLGFQLTF
jgi:hypothetical protein